MRTYLTLALSSAICLVLGFYAGSNYLNWIYFNDDNEIRESVYHDAIQGLVADAQSSDRSMLLDHLELMRPDFFRDKEYECVRFMPRNGHYAFVKAFCRRIADGSVVISYY